MTAGCFADGLVVDRGFPLPTVPTARHRAISAASAAQTKNARGGNPGRSEMPAALRRTMDMPTVTQPCRRRQLAAAQCALLRWYPCMPLRLIDALRLHRPGYPLILGGLAKQGRAR